MNLILIFIIIIMQLICVY